MRHARQHLRTITEALNALEREGWEPKDGEFTLSSLDAIPFGHNEQQDMSGLPTKMVIWFDNERNEWRSDQV